MMKQKLQMRIVALVLWGYFTLAACHAAQPQIDERPERMTLPFHYSPGGPDPMAAFRELATELRDRARREAQDHDYEPIVQSEQMRDGSWTLISAITPRTGVFYWMLTGPYGPPGSHPILPAQESISVCRFKLSWDQVPGGPIVPGLSWATFGFPEPDCSPPGREIERLTEWQRARAVTPYTMLTHSSVSNVSAWLVRRGEAREPFDSSVGVSAIMDHSDPVVRATPIATYGWTSSFLITRSGRRFISFPDRFSHSISCIVEGLEWRDLAARYQRPSPMNVAQKLCEGLEKEYYEKEVQRLNQESKTTPIITTPIK